MLSGKSEAEDIAANTEVLRSDRLTQGPAVPRGGAERILRRDLLLDQSLSPLGTRPVPDIDWPVALPRPEFVECRA